MENKRKTIGILTSGGDAPGMNAAIRAVLRTAVGKGVKVKGIYRGFNGLLEGGKIKELKVRDVAGIIHRGGTMLYTARSEKFKQDEYQEIAAKRCRDEGIDGVVVIGGDGTFRGAEALCSKGIPCVAIPGTIDNDIGASDYTIGFDTAVNTATEMIDKLRDTAQSHDRCSVVEVMGRESGYIALNTAIACGASAVLIPEIKQDLNSITEVIESSRRRGKQNFIIVVAEGVDGGIEPVADYIFNHTGMATMTTVLGHVQRGGNPTVRDRVIASQMGSTAVNLLIEGQANKVVVMKNDDIIGLDIDKALNMKKTIDKELLNVIYELSI